MGVMFSYQIVGMRQQADNISNQLNDTKKDLLEKQFLLQSLLDLGDNENTDNFETSSAANRTKDSFIAILASECSKVIIQNEEEKALTNWLASYLGGSTQRPSDHSTRNTKKEITHEEKINHLSQQLIPVIHQQLLLKIGDAGLTTDEKQTKRVKELQKQSDLAQKPQKKTNLEVQFIISKDEKTEQEEQLLKMKDEADLINELNKSADGSIKRQRFSI